MKALYITYDGLTDPLGQSQVLPYLRGLAEHIEWTVLSFEKKSDQDPDIIRVQNDVIRHNIKWLRVRFRNRLPFISRTYTMVWAIIHIFFKRSKYDYIHVRSYVSAFIGLCANVRHRAKFIFDMRGFWPEEQVFRGRWTHSSLSYRVAKRIERHFIKQADTVITLTDRAKKIMETDATYPRVNRIVMIPTCVDMNKFCGKPKQIDSIRLCYSGSLGTWYCLEEMLKFYRLLRKDVPSAQLDLLVNWTSWKEMSNDDRKKMEVREKIGTYSSSYEKLPEYLRGYTMGLFFIRPSYAKLASCPTKLGEFLAMGMPIIANRGIGDYAMWIEEENLGVVVDDFSDISLSRGINDLKNILKNESISKNCINFARKHLSLEVGLSRYRSVFHCKGYKNEIRYHSSK